MTQHIDYEAATPAGVKPHRVSIGAALLGAVAAILATFPTAAPAHGTNDVGVVETKNYKGILPNVPGKSLIALEVEFAPGLEALAHTHEKSAFIYAYVLSGEVISAVDDEEPRLYRAGESWQELPGAHHRVSRNASKTKPAKLLAVFVADSDASQLTIPDPK